GALGSAADTFLLRRHLRHLLLVRGAHLRMVAEQVVADSVGSAGSAGSANPVGRVGAVRPAGVIGPSGPVGTAGRSEPVRP
ncbi:MAG TPA: hypothetical protein VIS06_07600, partial [Mycobacteriales bacterium]